MSERTTGDTVGGGGIGAVIGFGVGWTLGALSRFSSEQREKFAAAAETAKEMHDNIDRMHF